jgi:rare lipoprotein A
MYGAPGGISTTRYGLLLIGLLLASCATGDGPPRQARQPAPTPRTLPDAVPRVEPPSNRGNPESYVVLGKRYFVLPSNEGYVERGIASWRQGSARGAEMESRGSQLPLRILDRSRLRLPLCPRGKTK